MSKTKAIGFIRPQWVLAKAILIMLAIKTARRMKPHLAFTCLSDIKIYPFLDAELGYSVLDDYKNEWRAKNSTDSDMLEIATLWHFPGDKAEPYLRIAYAQSEISVTLG